ncbi:hypothetical protein HG531_010923 [Fusarium graminearum]|nr:hypothetical protein HG531_010923 [Fusarium graminearum]
MEAADVSTVGDLESLELSDDLGCAGVLVKVHDSDATSAIFLRLRAEAHLLGSRVANVDKCQVGQVHAEEGQAGWNMVMKSGSQNLVVLGRLDQILEGLKHILSLGRDGIPSLSEAADRAAVKTANDGHEAVIVVKLKALVRNLDPLLDDLRALFDLLLLKNGLSDEVGQLQRVKVKDTRLSVAHLERSKKTELTLGNGRDGQRSINGDIGSSSVGLANRGNKARHQRAFARHTLSELKETSTSRRQRRGQLELGKWHDQVKSVPIGLIPPVGFKPALESIVYSQADGPGHMGRVVDIVVSLNERLGKPDWCAEKAEGKVKGRDEHGIGSRFVSGEAFDKSWEGTTSDLTFLVEHELMSKGLLHES